MGLTKWEPAGASNGIGPLNGYAPSGESRQVTIKNMGPETAWLGDSAVHGQVDSDYAYPLGAGETVTFPVNDSTRYYAGTNAPGATLWVWTV